MGKYTDLQVWNKSKDLAVGIYKLTESGSFGRDYRFRDQIRSAAISVPSNIAEGDELDTNKQSNRHFYIAKGSVAEIITQLIIAYEIGYIDEVIFKDLKSEYEHISHMLARIIKARK